MLKSTLLIGASVAAALTLGSGLAAAEPVEIRIQWSVTPAHMTPLIPHAPKGVYRHWADRRRLHFGARGGALPARVQRVA